MNLVQIVWQVKLVNPVQVESPENLVTSVWRYSKFQTIPILFSGTKYFWYRYRYSFPVPIYGTNLQPMWVLNFASLRWSGVLLTSLASDLNSALRGSCACIFVAGNLSKHRKGRNLNPGGAMQWMMTRTRRTTPAQLLWSPPSILHDLKCLKYPPCVDLTRPMGIFKAQLWSLYKVVLGNMSTIPVLRKIVI